MVSAANPFDTHLQQCKLTISLFWLIRSIYFLPRSQYWKISLCYFNNYLYFFVIKDANVSLTLVRRCDASSERGQQWVQTGALETRRRRERRGWGGSLMVPDASAAVACSDCGCRCCTWRCPGSGHPLGPSGAAGSSPGGCCGHRLTGTVRHLTVTTHPCVWLSDLVEWLYCAITLPCVWFGRKHIAWC